MINELAIFATTRCNLNCVHCMIDFPAEPVDFSLDVLERLMDESRIYGVEHVGLSGGEACLHPEFEKMVALIVKKGYIWSYVTNGILIEPYLKAIRTHPDSLDHVVVSVDGADAETHDAIRARKGAFKLTTTSVERYVAEGIPVIIQPTLNSRNKHQVEDFINLAQQLDVKKISFGGMIPTPRNTALAISERELLELYLQIQELMDQVDIPIRIASSLHTRGGIDFCNSLHLHQIMFNEYGELMFCCDSQQDGAIVGSIHNEPLPDLIDKWLKLSATLQADRAKLITKGQMLEGFDTCRFCNQYFSREGLWD